MQLSTHEFLKTVHLKHLELELVQIHLAQKPMLRAEVYTHPARAGQSRR